MKQYEMPTYVRRDPKTIPPYMIVNGIVERTKGNTFGEVERLVRQYQ
ncbi:MAG: hypothetical protein V1645_00825 [archaeon]